MGRRRTRLELSATQQVEARRLLHSSKDGRALERLRFALEAASGRHTLEELASQVGRKRSTIQNWLAKFHRGGLVGLLERDSAPGRVSPIANIQKQMVAGLKTGRWSSAAQVAAWLQTAHGITRSRKSIYYWFEKWRMHPDADSPPRRMTNPGAAAFRKPA